MQKLPRINASSETLSNRPTRSLPGASMTLHIENFDPATGAGLGAHPFTGWTATIALLKEESPATKQREDL